MQVMEVFQEMVYKGCERSVITYSSLISACEKARPALPSLHACVLLKHVGLLHAQRRFWCLLPDWTSEVRTTVMHVGHARVRQALSCASS